jgi:hypothetical protein
MKASRFTGPLVAAAFALLLSACEGSPVPLSDPPTVPVDTTLAGYWEYTSPDSEPPHDRLLIVPFNRNEYYVEFYSSGMKDSNRQDTTRVRAWLTEVAGRRFANIECLLCGSEPDFLFMDVRREGERLLLAPIESDLYDAFTADMTPEQVRARLAGALVEGLVTEEPAVFTRLR